MAQKFFNATALGPRTIARPNAVEVLSSQMALNALAVLEMMMLDPTADPRIRKECAVEILDRAVGKPAVAINTKIETNVNTSAPIIEGDIARAESDAMSTELVMSHAGKLPVEMWPDHVRVAAGFLKREDAVE